MTGIKLQGVKGSAYDLILILGNHVYWNQRLNHVI